MNKEQAINQIKKIIDEQYTDLRHWGNVNPTFPQEKNKRVEEINKHIQALDIAIESLQQDQQTKEKMWAKQLNECKECKELNNEWVDVKDRLPSEEERKKNYGMFLTTTDSQYLNIFELCYGYSHDLEKECFYDYEDTYGDIEVDDVIAWKPLPQPYEIKE